MPPSTKLINSGASTSGAIRSISSVLWGASTKRMSAPAARSGWRAGWPHETQWPAGIGPCDDEHFVVRAGVQCRGQSLQERRRIDDPFVGQVAAALWKFLVLQLDCRDAGVLVLADGAYDVEWGAVAGIGVGEQRDVAERRDRSSGRVPPSPSGSPDRCRGARTRTRRRRRRSGRRRRGRCAGELRGDAIVDAGGDDQFTFGQQVRRRRRAGVVGIRLLSSTAPATGAARRSTRSPMSSRDRGPPRRARSRWRGRGS